MICPNCSFSNSDDARFCENCGQPLERRCPNCSEPVSPTAKFCKNCGFHLAAGAGAEGVAQAETLSALRKAAPEAIASKILSERERLQGERKLVTALFADIVGSTALAEAMDPEDWREIVGGAHVRISNAVYRYEGTIAQLLGDGVLAFFGAPLAHEDDAERAIRAALDIQAAMRSYAEELHQRGSVQDFRVRIGLNSGLVVVGNIGTDLHMEYLAIGDTVNLAARMQSAAEPGSILISGDTFRLSGPVFEFEDLGRIEVKGKSDEIRVYRVVGELRGAGRARGIQGLESPMVGRQVELSTLNQVLKNLYSGRGSIVGVVGEAGLGKSRLVAEWKRAAMAEAEAEGRRLHWVEGRCLSYGVSMAHHLSTDLLRALIEAPSGSSEEETRSALWQTTTRLLGEGMEEVYPYLGHLLGLTLQESMGAKLKHLDGPALQAKYVAAYRGLLGALAAEAPLVVVCEDIHWADPSSTELGIQVLPMAAERPIVFALVSRPDEASAGYKMIARSKHIPGGGFLEVDLSRLTDVDSRKLVSNLLAVEALPTDLRDLILVKTEGNPFFVEEMIRMLMDDGVIAQQDGRWIVAGEVGRLEIPDTLQGVLTARIDRLPEQAKRALQIASVIGRTFQVRVLEQVLQDLDRSA